MFLLTLHIEDGHFRLSVPLALQERRLGIAQRALLVEPVLLLAGLSVLSR